MPVAQSAALADALRAAGTHVERHVYEGEGHGWRRAATIADDFDRVERVPRPVGAPALSPVADGFQGPKRGADRAVLLAHGAGADMHAAALTVVADALADARFRRCASTSPTGAPESARPIGRRCSTRRCVRPCRSLRAAPSSLPTGSCSAAARWAAGSARSSSGDADEPVPVLGLALLGYPLHPPGKPETLRVEHFKRLAMPVLFVSGTRDAFGSPSELKRHAKKIKGPVSFHWIETGDHGFKPLKASGLTPAAALEGAAAAVVDFVTAL